MLIDADISHSRSTLRLAPNFRAWQRNTIAERLLPVIAIGGTRGKSTVVRMLDEIYRAAHLRTATWTDQGIEVRGRKQLGELVAWSTTLSRVAAGTIDVAIQELDWSTIHAVGLPPNSYPIVAITNVWPDPDHHDDSRIRLAERGTERIVSAVHPRGQIVATSEDYRLMDLVNRSNANRMLAARSAGVPPLQAHLQHHGASIWIEDDTIILGDGTVRHEVMPISVLAASLRGQAMFQVSNAMTAIAIAYTTGIGLDTIRDALTQYRSDGDRLPGSFNVQGPVPVTTVVNRVESPGITRAILRAANPRGRKRQLTVIGDLAKQSEEECEELGRLVGRYHGAILLHSQSDEHLVRSLRHGVATNEYPPLIIHQQTERRALNRVFQTAQPDDVIVVFVTDDGRAANRAVTRFFEDTNARIYPSPAAS